MIAVVCLLIWVTVKVFRVLPSRYDPSKAIPLQVCDWVGLVAPLAIWTGWRPLRAILYFWGLGLSSQAFIQPDLAEGPADPSFWPRSRTRPIRTCCPRCAGLCFTSSTASRPRRRRLPHLRCAR